ncbi:Peptidase family M50 [compost metagenome]
MDSVKSVILNEVIIINFVLFIINLIPIPPLDGSKVITEPLTIFFSTIGIKKKAIYMIINVLSFFGVIVMFIPKISNIIIIFIRDHLKTTVFLQVLIVTLIFVLIYEIKTYKE